MNSYSMAKIPAFIREESLINEFLVQAKTQPETTRIDLAGNLWQKWQQQDLVSQLFPGVPHRNDFWFLTQILAQNQLYDLNKESSLFQYQSHQLYLIEVNTFLDSPQLAQLFQAGWRLPTFAEILVLAYLNKIRITAQPILLNQLRIEPDLTVLQLIAGHKQLGGSGYIDGLIMNKHYQLEAKYLVRET